MASITRQVRGEAQKAIAKSFEGLCGRHSRWEVWADWITMSACSISCAVDATHREAREKLYQTARAKYTEAELQVMAEMLGMGAGLDLSRRPGLRRRGAASGLRKRMPPPRA